MRNWLVIALIISLCGCGVSQYTARTVVDYETAGIKAHYESNKNQEHFKAKVSLNPDGTLKDLDIQTTATTPEAAIAAAMNAQTAFIESLRDVFKTILPLIEKGAMAGS